MSSLVVTTDHSGQTYYCADLWWKVKKRCHITLEHLLIDWSSIILPHIVWNIPNEIHRWSFWQHVYCYYWSARHQLCQIFTQSIDSFNDILRISCRHLGDIQDHLGTTLGPLKDQSGTTLGPPWDHSWTNLGSLWDHSDTTLRPLWNHSGTTLGSIWDHSEEWTKP